MTSLRNIDERSLEVFRRIVDTYIASGEPVGSRTLSRADDIGVSPATIRNVMADLTDLGLLHAPHVSAGRLPTEIGMRFFVDSLLQVGNLSEHERQTINAASAEDGRESPLEQAASRLSGLTHSASLVVMKKTEAPLRQLEFIATAPGEALVVLVFEDGLVENRIVKTPMDLPASSLIKAGNYLSTRLNGKTMAEARMQILTELNSEQAELDSLTAKLVKEGVAEVSGSVEQSLIVRGRGHLLDEATEQDLERVRLLFDDLERKQEVIDLLNAASDGKGVKIFIGSENRLFSLSGSSVIVAPYRDRSNQIVGAVGVIGPTRLNYAKVIPIVDYTAEVMSDLLK